MRSISTALLGASILATGLPMGSAFAEDNLLETITVTASRTPLQIKETGSSVSIITKEQIQRRNATNLGELLREIPGISVNQQGSLGAVTQVRIRGAEANQVLVLIDGVEANDIAQGSEFNFTHLLTRQIERVEIVRGPQSSLWGSDALSGVINIITSPQGLDKTQFSGYLEGGTFNTVKTGFGIQHGSERSQTTVSVDFLDTDGSNISREGNEDDGYKNVTYNLSGKYDIQDNIRLNYVARKTDSTTEFDAIDFFTTGLPTDADYTTDSKQTYTGVSLVFDQDKLSHLLAYTRTDTENVNRAGSPVKDITRGTKDRLQYQGNLELGSSILTGVIEYEKEDYLQRGAASFFGDPNKNLDTNTKSVALEYRYNGESVNISLSARNDNNSEFNNATTWRTTAAWHLPNDTTNFFASIGESVKNPTFTERFGFFDTFVGNPNLKPEESLSWEIGVRQSLADNRMFVTATWFDANLDNEINGFVFDPSSGSFTAANIEGKSNRQGLELALDYKVSAFFSMNASYTYLDATQDNPAGGDLREVRRPKHAGAVGGNVQWGKTNINLQVIYTGKQEDDFFPPFPPFQERVELDAYTLVNLTGTYRISDKFELSMQLENAFDENYEEVFGFSSPGLVAYGGMRMRW